MQCPLCNQTYNSGKFCTSCQGPDGGAVLLVASEQMVDPNDLDQYIKMLDVFLSDGFLGVDEKETLRGLRQQYGISEQQHQSILKENGYKYRDTMPIRMVLNRKTIQGYGAGQPCLAKVRLVNMERMPLQRVEIRYWLNSEEVHTTLVRQLMPNKVYDVDLDFIPQKSGQYALKMELTVDPFVGDEAEYVVESTSFQVYSQSQLQSVHIHQSGENIVGNHKIYGTDIPQAMLLGDGQWDELTLSPKQRAAEWGEWASERLFTNVNESIQSASQQYGMTPEFQAFVKGVSLERKENEDFITWEERLKVIQRGLNEVTSKVSARLETERKQKEAEERRKREAAEKRQRELKAAQERKAREEAERKRKEEENRKRKEAEKHRLTKAGNVLYKKLDKLLDKASYGVKQEIAFGTLRDTCRHLRTPDTQDLQGWVSRLTQQLDSLPSEIGKIEQTRNNRLENQRKETEAEEKRQREAEAKKEREGLVQAYRELLSQLRQLQQCHVQGHRELLSQLRQLQQRLEEERRQQQKEQERKEREARAKAKREKEERERKAREEAERQRRAEEERKREEAEQRRLEQERKKRETEQPLIDEGKRQRSIPREEIVVKGKYGGFFGFGKRTTEYPMVRIPAGWFMMGALEDDEFAEENEKPRHKVTLTRDFMVGKYPVTQALWQSVMGSNSASKYINSSGEKVGWLGILLMKILLFWGGRELQKVYKSKTAVNWLSCVKFCNELSKREGLEPIYTINGNEVTCNWGAKGYRLLTEAEWEYSARGGEYHTFLSNINEFGLHFKTDVQEWVWDCTESDDELVGYLDQPVVNPTGSKTGSDRITRGFPSGGRISRRSSGSPRMSNDLLGFRIARFV